MVCPICLGWLSQHKDLHKWLKCNSCGYSILKEEFKKIIYQHKKTEKK